LQFIHNPSTFRSELGQIVGSIGIIMNLPDELTISAALSQMSAKEEGQIITGCFEGIHSLVAKHQLGLKILQNRLDYNSHVSVSLFINLFINFYIPFQNSKL
jgi:hypothetical protein